MIEKQKNNDSRELYFFFEEDQILDKKYREIRINSDYPELFWSPSFLIYVNKHRTKHNTIKQEELNSLFESYKNEMELQLRKKVNGVKIYKILLYSSLLIFVLSFALETFGLTVFSVIILAILNFCSPKTFTGLEEI
jgi:hypothetical protein